MLARLDTKAVDPVASVFLLSSAHTGTERIPF